MAMLKTVVLTLTLQRGIAVSTPFGERSPKCVVEVPEGSTVVTTESGVGLQHANGLTEDVPVAQECREDGITERHAARIKSRSSAPPNSGGWLDNVGFTDHGGYSKFTGSFNVPGNPPQPRKPETLYYFFGMENTGGNELNILQPVLTWGDESEGGAGGWSVWSWACCPSTITFHSKNIGGLEEGMIVNGTIDRVDSSTWSIDTTFTDKSGQQKNTTLSARLPYRYTWADVTLEVYNLTNCGEHSPGTVTFNDLILTNAQGTQITPSWSGASTSSCGGRVTVHDPQSISIKHTTGTSMAVV